MMGKFTLFKSFCWKKDAREAKRFISVQQEPGGGGAEMPAGLKVSERRHWPIPGRPGGEARFQSQRVETF